MSTTVTTGASNLTICVRDGGCTHDGEGPHAGLAPLGCYDHDYEHPAGVYCRTCNEQFWGWCCP